MNVNLQLFGGRGSSGGNSSGGTGGSSNGASGGSGGRFSSETEFESSLTGFSDPRLQDYNSARENALSDFDMNGNRVQNLTDMAKHGELGGWSRQALESERRQAQEALDSLPSNKTPAQLGEASALSEVVNSIDKILSITPTESSRNPYNINIVD